MFYLRWSYRRVRRIQRQFTPYEWAVLAVIALILIALAYGLAMKAAPFEPYTAADFAVIPEEACAFTTIRVEVERTIEEGYKVREIDYRSYWVNTETGLRIVSQSGELSTIPRPKEKFVSPVVREVPPVAGEYELVSELKVRGSIGGVPRTQQVTLRTDDPLVLNAPGEKGCPGLAVEDP